MATVKLDGRDLDASFSVSAGATSNRFTVIINSASGPRQDQPGVNREYKPAFDAILARLGDIQATVEGIWLAPTTGSRRKSLLDVEGRSYPWHMSADDDFRRMRLDIGRAQESTNREPGARGSGNRTKRVEIQLSLKKIATAEQLEAWLAAQEGSPALSFEVAVPENPTGRELARRWGLEVQQALYRKTGDWFHQLTRFPGALLDAEGYILFETKASFDACSQLRMGKNPGRNGGWMSAPAGIKSLPGYVQVVGTEKNDEESQLQPPFLGVAYRVQDEHAALSGPAPFDVDPTVVERGTLAHRATQNALAQFLQERGLPPLSPAVGDPDFDIAWRFRDRLFVGEVKSITARNEEKQLRLGLGQVLRYAQQLARNISVTPVLIAERCPIDPTWQTLCNQLGVILLWPERFGEFPDAFERI
jgi:hypothetical protein